MKNNEPVIIEQIFDSTAGKVWDAITEISKMNQWYFKELESFKPEVGFETQFNVHVNDKDYFHLWKVTEVIPLKKIVYSWKYRDYQGDSCVSWELFPENNKTILKLTHSGIETFPQNNPDFSYESCTAGWTYFVRKSLKEYLEKT